MGVLRSDDDAHFINCLSIVVMGILQGGKLDHEHQNVFLTKNLQVFLYIWYAKTRTNLDKVHVKWQARFRFWHVVTVTLVKKKTTRQLILYKLKWHVLLGMWCWGDTLEENVDANWHSFLFLKMPCATLDLKLNVKWNLSNIHIDEHKHYQQFGDMSILWGPGTILKATPIHITML